MSVSMVHQGERIHILLALTDPDGGYAKFAGTMLCSLFANTNHPVTVHIMHDHTLRSSDKERLQQLAAASAQTLCFYDMDELARAQMQRLQEEFRTICQGRFSAATMYRLLAGEILPADLQYVIYLDADIVVQLDIAELWQQKGRSSLAAVPDHCVQYDGHPLADKGYFALDHYFNAGVLVMQMAAFRARPLWSDGLRFLQEAGCMLPDQDILNYFFQQDCLFLPDRFNILVNYQLSAVHSANACEPGIYHYGAHTLSFRADCDTFSLLFFHYFAMTSWCNGYFLMKLMQRSQQAERQQGIELIKRGRAFLCRAEDYDKLKESFGIQPDEPCFLLQHGHLELSLDKLQERILFVCVPYMSVRNLLLQAGLQPYVDFQYGRLYCQSAPPDNEHGLQILLASQTDYHLFCHTLSD